MIWHITDVKEVLQSMNSNAQTGLAASDAADRTARIGANELVERGGRTPLRIIWEQVTATMVLILIAAAIVSAVMGDVKNTTAILSIVVLFVILGFVQEYRAEKAIAALKKMSVPNVRVLRDGILSEISARNLVPGDIVQIETGNIIPADMRLIEAVNLRIQESALTGESESIEKNCAALENENLQIGDRVNMAYMGTVVTQGRGSAVVTDTGMQTELGKIAGLIQGVGQEPTPLQKRLDSLGKNLALIGTGISVLIFALGVWRGDEVRHMLLTAVSVAVAIVPEGLPAVVTITLALGAQRMLKKNALIRKLPAVETLGSVTVICSDKTGTLTENRMTVVVLDVAGHTLDLSVDAGGKDRLLTMAVKGLPVQSSLTLAAAGGALCNDAMLVDRGDDAYHVLGDPTETAIVSAALRMGYLKTELDRGFPRVAEVPFDSERKRMTTVHEVHTAGKILLPGIFTETKKYIAFAKGGIDGLLGVATGIWSDGETRPIDDEWRYRITKTNEQLAGKGMRVLGVAFRLLDSIPENASIEKDLTIVGLFGMIDPPRKEVKAAVETCRAAGIRPVMITGDHPLTAVEIARQLGIAENDKALTGAEIENMGPDELKKAVGVTSVFARVAPEHKLKIVQALQENGEIVSMTGDGVNDAPALRRADIGVAMGITGTDVSKEAADLVLLDDNFTTIVSAVKQGRTIYDNIRKFVKFSVAGNIGKVLVMFLAPFIGKPIPLLPLQLLWLNLLTDGLLGLGMGVENPERDAMSRKPYHPREGVFSRGGGFLTLFVGILIGALALGIGSWYYYSGRSEWRTMIFTSLAFMQVFQVLASRSARDSLFTIGVLGNRLLLLMVVLVIGLQCLVIYTPVVQDFFSVAPLSLSDFAVAVASGIIVFIAIEIAKKMLRMSGSNP
ncbi:MAG TPA: cation-translocating P-type ATPase [Spirochaetota bacterium]|nr:cation-translocating P-type ATPase [Spirochaetota bacterium]